MSKTVTAAVMAIMFGITCGLAGGGRADDKAGAVVRVGFVNTLFRNVPRAFVSELMQPFDTLMTQQTGLRFEMATHRDYQELAAKMESGQVRLGVFHGIEFAWARQQHPDLKPLVLAVNQQRILHAYLVVRGDAALSSFSDLKGKSLALFNFTREHCLCFLGSNCKSCGKQPEEFFSKIVNTPNVERTLDNVARGAVNAALIDGVGLEWYKQKKPQVFSKLKVLKQSEPFPASVIAYAPSAVDEATVKRLRDGLIQANKESRGQEVLALCRLTAFEAVPDDYEQSLETIAKTYPPAASKTSAPR